MALTDDLRRALMHYCKIDELSEDDAIFLEECYLGAVGYMANAGVSQPTAGTERAALYNLCIKPMVLEAWDNRQTVTSGTVQNNPVFRWRLNQLKMTEPVPDSGTE